MNNLKLKHGLWVVVADGEKALFLENDGDTQYPDLQVVQEMEQENPATREQGSDRPGRFSDGPSSTAAQSRTLTGIASARSVSPTKLPSACTSSRIAATSRRWC